MFRWSTQWDLTSSAMPAECATATLAPNTDVVLRTRPSRYLPRLNPPNLSCCAYPTLWMLRSVHHSRTFQRFICVLHCIGRRRIVSPCSANTLIGTRPAAVHGMALQQRDGPGPARGLVARLRPAAGARVHGLPPAADGGGGRARERRAGLGGAQLAAGQGDGLSLLSRDGTAGGRRGASWGQ